MLAVPRSFLDMPRWWHDEPGRGWLAELPSLVARLCDQWNLDVDGKPLHGSNALVVPVRRGGDLAALRLAPPGDDVAAETAALSHWAGRGVVQLLNADPGVGASLLERLDHSLSLQSVPVGEAVHVLGELARLLAVPAPDWARSTCAIAREASTNFLHEWERVDQPTSRTVVDSACEMAGWLSEQPVSMDSVNGDLHFEQVLAGRRHPWTVVDPILLSGDREYDVGRVLWSRIDELKNERQIVAAFDAFVAAAEVPPERARAWVIVRSMSYLLWGLQHGLTKDPPNCHRLLELFA
jgi:streptomycin 6-kinase